MTSCEASRPAPLRCPTQSEVLSSALALLPRGRAWQSNEGGPREGSVLRGFWSGIAGMFAFANERLCALRLEFWCATQSETRDLWLAEYGLPDACDPFPDLCTKVAAIGGTRCEYYASIAARAGWSIDCIDRGAQCGVAAGGGAKAGHAQPGSRLLPAQLIIRVFPNESPAYGGRRQTPSKPGRMKAGMPIVCGPDLQPLKCILERIIHAEIQTLYEVVT